MQHLGADADGERWKITPNDPAVLAQLKPGMQMHRNRDHAWGTSAEQKIRRSPLGVWLTLSDDADGLALTLTDEDGWRHPPCAAGAGANPRWRTRWPACANNWPTGQQRVCRPRHHPAPAPALVCPGLMLNALPATPSPSYQALRVAQWPRRRAKPRVEPPPPTGTSLSYLANVIYTTWPASLHPPRRQPDRRRLRSARRSRRSQPDDHQTLPARGICAQKKQAKGVKGVMGQVRADPMVLKNGNETYAEI